FPSLSSTLYEANVCQSSATWLIVIKSQSPSPSMSPPESATGKAPTATVPWASNSSGVQRSPAAQGTPAHITGVGSRLSPALPPSPPSAVLPPSLALPALAPPVGPPPRSTGRGARPAPPPSPARPVPTTEVPEPPAP